MLTSWKKSYDQPRQHIKNRDVTLPTKVHVVKAMVFPVVMYSCESWSIKKAEHWRIDAFDVVLEKTLASPLDCKEIQPGNQPWIFTGRTAAEADTPILWPPDGKNQLTGKEPYAGKDWGQKGKGTAEDEWLDGITDLMDVNLSKLQEEVKGKRAWCATIHGVTKNWTRFSK